MGVSHASSSCHVGVGDITCDRYAAESNPVHLVNGPFVTSDRRPTRGKVTLNDIQAAQLYMVEVAMPAALNRCNTAWMQAMYRLGYIEPVLDMGSLPTEGMGTPIIAPTWKAEACPPLALV